MKQKLKIFGIVATLLLLIVGIGPAIMADAPEPRQNPTDIEEIFIENWDNTSAICDYWDEYGSEAELDAEMEESLEEIAAAVDVVIRDAEEADPDGGITWFFPYFFAPHEWWFSASSWESANDTFNLFLDWQAQLHFSWNWVIWLAKMYLYTMFFFRGHPIQLFCGAMAKDIIYEVVSGPYRYTWITDQWNGEDGIWLETQQHLFPFFYYTFEDWGHQS